jgi:dihydrofolate reductase
MEERKLILYIAASLDGYIAKPNDDLSFLSRVQKKGEDYGYNDFISTVDTVILGRKTYDWVLNQVSEFPHADKEAYIITRKEKPKKGNITFYTGNLKDLISRLKIKVGKNIFCDGGAEIVNELLKEKLFDELIISVIPVLLGNGTRLFQNDKPEQDLRLLSANKFDTGLVQLHYKVIRN